MTLDDNPRSISWNTSVQIGRWAGIPKSISTGTLRTSSPKSRLRGGSHQPRFPSLSISIAGFPTSMRMHREDERKAGTKHPILRDRKRRRRPLDGSPFLALLRYPDLSRTHSGGVGVGRAPRIVWPTWWGHRSRARKPEPRPALAAGEALAKARCWQTELDSRCVWAELARRERLSRARVTQFFRLLKLPTGTHRQLLDGGRAISIRAALASLRNAG